MAQSDLTRFKPLELDSAILTQNFNRKPFGFPHNLGTLDIFKLGSLASLAKEYSGHSRDYFVTSGASEAGQTFFSVDPVNLELCDAFEHLQERPIRILLKRLEDYDPRFRELLNELVAQVVDQLGGLKGDQIARAFSSVFITSSKTLTPFHFDPSIGFFCQIAGEKFYHIYPPDALNEAEMEQFYRRQVINIAQVDLKARDPGQEHVFHLSAGKGFHQPQNAPHWVETREELSVSYSVNFDTLQTRKLGRTRGFNYYMRRIGVSPKTPGENPSFDSLKAGAVQLMNPLRKVAQMARRVSKNGTQEK